MINKKIAALLFLGLSFPMFSMQTLPMMPGYSLPSDGAMMTINEDVVSESDQADNMPLLNAPAIKQRWYKKRFGTWDRRKILCCGASCIAASGIITGAVLMLVKSHGDILNPIKCPPWNWNKANVGYEPCTGDVIPAGASQCQLQYLNNSCVPYFHMRFPSSWYKNIHGSIECEQGVRLGSCLPMICGEPEDGSEMLLAFCHTKDWNHDKRKKLCRAQGKPDNCSFPWSNTSNASHATCAMSADQLINGVTAVFTPAQYDAVLINAEEYEAIAAQPDLIESPKCSLVKKWMRTFLDGGWNCPNFPQEASPRTHWPVDPEHEQCYDF